MHKKFFTHKAELFVLLQQKTRKKSVISEQSMLYFLGLRRNTKTTCKPESNISPLFGLLIVGKYSCRQLWATTVFISLIKPKIIQNILGYFINRFGIKCLVG